jgi:phosphatidylethanolamine/phosphatidyl-N-methylethanolamine N-methyltransferase
MPSSHLSSRPHVRWFGPRARRALADQAHFLKTLIDRPRLTGAVAPSGPWLARAMARAVDPAREGLVIELGPGTGPVTRALIERGVARERLALIEYDHGFCRLLAQRFATARVIQGDAYDLPKTLAGLAGEPIAAVVSSLPLLNQPRPRRVKLLEDAFALMGPSGLFVQFTYGLVSPIPREACEGRFSAHCAQPIWRNLPPARVWTYRADPHGAFAEPLLARLIRRAGPAAGRGGGGAP